MATNITITNASPGFEYTVEAVMEYFYDDNGEQALTPPTTIVSGWAESEEEARSLAQNALESIE